MCATDLCATTREALFTPSACLSQLKPIETTLTFEVLTEIGMSLNKARANTARKLKYKRQLRIYEWRHLQRQQPPSGEGLKFRKK